MRAQPGSARRSWVGAVPRPRCCQSSDGHLGKVAVVLVPYPPQLADHLVVIAVGGDGDERLLLRWSISASRRSARADTVSFPVGKRWGAGGVAELLEHCAEAGLVIGA